MLTPLWFRAVGPDHSDLVADLLKELSNHNERSEERRAALLELLKVTREDSAPMWDEHFKTVLLLLLETLCDKDVSSGSGAVLVRFSFLGFLQACWWSLSRGTGPGLWGGTDPVLVSRQHTIRALALRVLKEILRNQPTRFRNYAELTIMKTLEAHKDSHKEVIRFWFWRNSWFLGEKY